MSLVPQEYREILVKFIFSSFVLVIAAISNKISEKFLMKRYFSHSHMHTLRSVMRNMVWLLSIIIVLFIWLGERGNFTVAMGILGAGIAFASQETIGSFTGFLNIVTSNLFQIGDRVRIGNVTGDVMDINLMRTTVMEIGEWVKADQYTGRVVSVANNLIFSNPVINYTKNWHFLWDEITIPITYDSDWRLAEEIILKHGQDYSKNIQEGAFEELRTLNEKYPLQKATVEPRLFVTLTDNWIEMTLRYVTKVSERREVKGKLHYELLTHFGAEPTITIASSTFEIVGFPPLKRDSEIGKG